MLNLIWAFMILCGILCGVLTGNVGALTDAALDGAGDAITLCLTMAGAMALWMGLMEVAKEAGLVERMTKGIAPFLSFLFPHVPKGHAALGYIGTNVIANVLGLGWACTPAGLKAMEALADLERERGNPEYAEERRKDADAGGNEEERRKDADAGGKGAGRPGIVRRERTASPEMCDFLILNVSSLQLIPVSIIAYRREYGSQNPAGIIFPALLATLVSTLTAILYCKWQGRRRER